MNEPQRFKIRGMCCAEEINALRQTVGSLAGVTDLDFNLLEGTMTARINDPAVTEARIRDAVHQAGLELDTTSHSAGGPTETHDPTWWQAHGQAALCAASAALTCAGVVAHAVIHGDTLHALTGGEGVVNHVTPLPVIVLYTAAVASGGWFVFPKAWLALRRWRADMNLLMTLAVGGAMVIGQWFEAATVSCLFALSLLLEAWSIARARRAIQALLSISPPTARYLCPCDGDIMETPVADVPIGVTVLVRPGERIPLDGVITRGRTTIDQSPITGESMPVAREEGAEVFAGTINGDGAFEFAVSRSACDTTLARIVRMVEQAQSRRAPVEQWIEKFARYYTPAMIVLALLIAVVPPLRDGQWLRWFYEALVILVIACPCALVISTPVSIVAALTTAARSGVLIKGGAFLEAMGQVNAVALDKTGTLTRGTPEVQQVVPLNGHTAHELLACAAALETHSEHPLGAAILRKARAEGVTPLRADGFRALQGRGAEAVIDGQRFWVGSHRLLRERLLDATDVQAQARQMEDAGHSLVIIGNDQHVCGLIGVADAIRPEAALAVRQLRAAGISYVGMLTGDNPGTANAVGQSLGLDEVRAELLPEDKLQAITALREKFGGVAMIGDGVNDAPALAAATVGISMGAAGTDTAIETSDIALMADDLTHLPWLVHHARRALAIVRQNIFFALGVKLAFMTLAMLQMATLWMAIAADMGASLLVIFNALRLLRR